MPRKGPEFDPRAAGAEDQFERVQLDSQVDPAWLEPPEIPIILGPGDVIEIEQLGAVQDRQLAVVGPDGRIYFSLLEGVDVWGMTLSEVAATLEDRLKKYFTLPKVSVSLRSFQSARYWILGRVVTPGVYSLEEPTTILEALGKARGLLFSKQSGTTEELADLGNGFLIRQGTTMPIDFSRLLREGEMQFNIYLQPDDYLYLPSALSSEIYVLGAVRQPRAVSFKDEVSLTRAIATAQGLTREGYADQVAIVRGALDAPSIAIVDYSRIRVGLDTDVALQPRDIVFVPTRPHQKIGDYARLVVDTFVRTAAINEGARAVTDQFSPSGVNIGVQ